MRHVHPSLKGSRQSTKEFICSSWEHTHFSARELPPHAWHTRAAALAGRGYKWLLSRQVFGQEWQWLGIWEQSCVRTVATLHRHCRWCAASVSMPGVWGGVHSSQWVPLPRSFRFQPWLPNLLDTSLVDSISQVSVTLVVANVRRTVFVRQEWNTPRKAGLVFSSRHPMSSWTLPRAFSISQHHGCCHLCISQHHRYGHLRILWFILAHQWHSVVWDPQPWQNLEFNLKGRRGCLAIKGVLSFVGLAEQEYKLPALSWALTSHQ